ncbi:MAG: ERAP1-like C-terminal domain-containing protein [Myxococcales bacterium]|nr:ERAP1-like C-terminal domain-containing protein [Myxococcales bacterium]
MPTRAAVEMTLAPDKDPTTATIEFDVQLHDAGRVIWLNSIDLHVTNAMIEAGGVRMPLQVIPGTADTIGFEAPRAIPNGAGKLSIEYTGSVSPKEHTGLFRELDNGNWYAFTKFESTDARRAFPCFDEPGWKTPYDVRIASPKGTLALTNGPETETSREEAPDGFVVHHFATSAPLPTYLVAFAVGDFDVVEWQKDPFPIRAVTTKGRGNLTGMALETASSFVSKLSEYFDIPYPYPKLDLVAVPDFAAGGMENPGLVTFRDTLLLLDPRRATVGNRRAQAGVLAHELAHQWFGDLVTMSWWDDIWLNEGFATWAQAMVVDSVRPGFGAALEQIAGVQHTMDIDALATARRVREPVNSKGEAEEAFDAITYDKGAAILRMIEGWLGPDVFRRGVQHYLREHAWKNAQAKDLFQALEFVSTQRVGELARGFLEQTGVPEVVVGWTCGTSVGNKLELNESEWRPLGATRAPRPAWTLPVCVDSDVQKGKSCFTLGRDLIARDLGAACPGWVYPNADQAGYYRFVLDAAHLGALARAARSLPVVDRVGLVSNAWAEVRQGDIPAGALFDLLPLLDGETNRYVVEQIVGVLAGMDLALVDDETRPAFRRWVAARMAARKAAVGWEPGPRDDDDRVALRRALLFAMGELAADPQTLGEAEEYAGRWLREPASVPAETAAVALPLASAGAGGARLAQLRAALEAAKTPEDRVLAIRAMGTFDDAEVLRKALDFAFGGGVKLSELRHLFGAANGRRAARHTLFLWEKENWAKVSARLAGSFGRGMLVSVLGGLCKRAERDEAEAFLVPAARGVEGLQRQLDENMELAGLCVALREHGAAEVAKRLQRR